MTFRILVSAPARRALEHSLPEVIAAAARAFINGALAENPHRAGKPLTGELTGMWSARRGEYRVVYAIDADTITVTVIRLGHRRDAYRWERSRKTGKPWVS
ncbi:MAG: type II toxin-antitoxin system RelE/ParE family toxin [Actinobacteria bacterium]|nr:type II toxin-antitoxin system RelE/ParE family toxin [Actinomycetota bacterium]